MHEWSLCVWQVHVLSPCVWQAHLWSLYVWPVHVWRPCVWPVQTVRSRVTSCHTTRRDGGATQYTEAWSASHIICRGAQCTVTNCHTAHRSCLIAQGKLCAVYLQQLHHTIAAYSWAPCTVCTLMWWTQQLQTYTAYTAVGKTNTCNLLNSRVPNAGKWAALPWPAQSSLLGHRASSTGAEWRGWRNGLSSLH